MPLDVNELIGKVAEQNGVRLDRDDPAFALVTLNELVLRDAARQVQGELHAAVSRFSEEVRRLDARSSAMLLQEAKLAGAEIRKELEKDIRGAGLKARELVYQAQKANQASAVWRWIAAGMLSALAIFGAGIIAGRLSVGLW